MHRLKEERLFTIAVQLMVSLYQLGSNINVPIVIPHAVTLRNKLVSIHNIEILLYCQCVNISVHIL